MLQPFASILLGLLVCVCILFVLSYCSFSNSPRAAQEAPGIGADPYFSFNRKKLGKEWDAERLRGAHSVPQSYLPGNGRAQLPVAPSIPYFMV